MELLRDPETGLDYRDRERQVTMLANAPVTQAIASYIIQADYLPTFGLFGSPSVVVVDTIKRSWWQRLLRR